MSKLIFSEQEVKRLRKNIYVKNDSYKAITYTLEFKKNFIKDYNNNELPRYIFEKYNFDIDIDIDTIGMERVKFASKRS
ncbi:MAG: HTH domain-containing protein [Psychrilyobacter sp.]|uniref:HTH domain-containing protein n=1 Tax=Psychrilyobacter sp. TaxID=2586924 RepID=UPI003C72FC46